MAKVTNVVDTGDQTYEVTYDDGTVNNITTDSPPSIGDSNGQATGSDVTPNSSSRSLPSSSSNDSTSSGTTDNSSGVTPNSSGVAKQYTLNGNTYYQYKDGSYQYVDEAGNVYNSSADEFNKNASDPSAVASTPASSTPPPTNPLTNLGTQIQNLLKGGGLGSAATTAGLAALAKALGGGSSSGLAGGTAGVYRGYQGGIPTLTASRNMNQIPANYRPGGGGMSYFSPVTFTDSSGNVVSGVAGSGSPMNKGDATGNITGPTSAGSLTPTNTLLPGGITTVGNTYVPPTTTTTTTNTGTTNTDTNNTTVNKPTTTTLTPAQQLLASLQNPTASGIAQFQAGTPSQITSGIQNALNAVGSPGTPATNKTIANLMDTWKVTPAEMAAATGLSTGEITNLYNQAKGITATPQTTSLSDIQSQLTNAANAYNTTDKTGGGATINNIIAANPGITISQIQSMFPGADLTPYLKAGIGSGAVGASTYQPPTPTASSSATSTPSNLAALQAAIAASTPPGTVVSTVPPSPATPATPATPASVAATNNAVGNSVSTLSTPTGIAATPTPTPVDTSVAPAPVSTSAAPAPAPSVADQLASAYNSGDISTVNNILASNQLTSTDISNMFPGFDTSTVSPAVSYYTPPVDNSASFGYDTAAAGGLMTTKRYARGGYAQGGISSLGTYSDGGRMLKGPGDGVSDSIPATIGGHQKAALADGEFVIPARIVSEIGNGSSDAGARKLYAMMDRIQNARKKTTKNVAANTRAEKYLPG